jgi:hypothetical protein
MKKAVVPIEQLYRSFTLWSQREVCQTFIYNVHEATLANAFQTPVY